MSPKFPKCYGVSLCYCVREGFKTPSHGKSPLGGYPPLPRGLNGQDFSVKLAKKNLTDKGGTPPTVPQEGVIFVKFKLFPKCFFLVCMINLGHLTRVFSIKTFLFQFLCDIEASQFLNSQKIVKKLNFFFNLLILI